MKIYQGNYPQKINVVIDGKVYTTAEFINGIYETTDRKIIKELKEYGYKTDGAEEPEVEKTEEPIEEPEVRQRRTRRGRN